MQICLMLKFWLFFYFAHSPRLLQNTALIFSLLIFTLFSKNKCKTTTTTTQLSKQCLQETASKPEFFCMHFVSKTMQKSSKSHMHKIGEISANFKKSILNFGKLHFCIQPFNFFNIIFEPQFYNYINQTCNQSKVTNLTLFLLLICFLFRLMHNRST